jgi:hypothetical protein
MNEMETKRKESYETPEIMDIKPVTTCKVVGLSGEPDYDGDI